MNILQGQYSFHFFMDFLPSNKVTIPFIVQGSEFQMTGPKCLIKFFPKNSVINFGTQKSDFERNFAEWLFITNILSKTSDARPCLALNISIANCVEYYFHVLYKICLVANVAQKSDYTYIAIIAL